jgi:hypothetical protein
MKYTAILKINFFCYISLSLIRHTSSFVLEIRDIVSDFYFYLVAVVFTHFLTFSLGDANLSGVFIADTNV